MELSAEQLRTIRESCRKFAVRRLFLFGSAARGERRADSDFDFAVEFDRVEAIRPSEQYFGLLFALQELLGTSIDLVSYKAIRNRHFRDEVDETKVELLCSVNTPSS